MKSLTWKLFLSSSIALAIGVGVAHAMIFDDLDRPSNGRWSSTKTETPKPDFEFEDESALCQMALSGDPELIQHMPPNRRAVHRRKSPTLNPIADSTFFNKVWGQSGLQVVTSQASLSQFLIEFDGPEYVVHISFKDGQFSWAIGSKPGADMGDAERWNYPGNGEDFELELVSYFESKDMIKIELKMPSRTRKSWTYEENENGGEDIETEHESVPHYLIAIPLGALKGEVWQFYRDQKNGNQIEYDEGIYHTNNPKRAGVVEFGYILDSNGQLTYAHGDNPKATSVFESEPRLMYPKSLLENQ